MKKLNIFLLGVFFIAFLSAIIGALMKVFGYAYSDLFLIVAIVLKPAALLGLLFANFSRIKQHFS